MSTIIYLRRTLAGFQPLDPQDQEAARSVKIGDIIKVEFSRPRNIQMHRLYWALCSLVAANTDVYPDAEAVSTAFKIATGHVVPHVNPADGKTYLIPQSISFAKMDQDTFKRFFDKCIDLVVTRLLPRVTREEVRAEIEAMVGISSGERRAS